MDLISLAGIKPPAGCLEECWRRAGLFSKFCKFESLACPTQHIASPPWEVGSSPPPVAPHCCLLPTWPLAISVSNLDPTGCARPAYVLDLLKAWKPLNGYPAGAASRPHFPGILIFGQTLALVWILLSQGSLFCKYRLSCAHTGDKIWNETSRRFIQSKPETHKAAPWLPACLKTNLHFIFKAAKESSLWSGPHLPPCCLNGFAVSKRSTNQATVPGARSSLFVLQHKGFRPMSCNLNSVACVGPRNSWSLCPASAISHKAPGSHHSTARGRPDCPPPLHALLARTSAPTPRCPRTGEASATGLLGGFPQWLWAVLKVDSVSKRWGITLEMNAEHLMLRAQF